MLSDDNFLLVRRDIYSLCFDTILEWLQITKKLSPRFDEEEVDSYMQKHKDKNFCAQPPHMQPGTEIDIDDRFRSELKALQLPPRVAIIGNAMLCGIAQRLLTAHAPETTIDDAAETRIPLMSMEQYGAAFLESFLEEHNPPSPHTLLSSIPETALQEYARKHGIRIVDDERSDVRKMLDGIAANQPQTYFSLAKSAKRLQNAAEALREQK